MKKLIYVGALSALLLAACGEEAKLKDKASAEPQENAENDYEPQENDNEPTWGTIKYGNLADLKTDITDANGTSGIQIGDSTPIMDMAANSEVTEKEDASSQTESINEDTPMQTDTTSANDISRSSSYSKSILYAFDLMNNASDTISMREADEAWDYELNRIYGLLRKKLSPENMDALKKEELAWIKSRDREVGDPEEVGVMTALEIRTSLTKERTLYLIDMYFDEREY
ncbi:lysozyme inhibitor LprI family protein [Lysinibacillus sp. Bpr_S20]|uniref:lysozyme inhibitor LprI family protein n=1 Tax=Lysinibacillus sp. Bpr_S20 TaxID=2933964 RepID=UPI0020112545|nr:lysozyme inhibitor LprI family protein [Lysinibacillus sp. Bpr_S20]MCL1701187.1 DUF1311 domain-containing protein [Lysinibacillus sp. Bpr_S20]